MFEAHKRGLFATLLAGVTALGLPAWGQQGEAAATGNAARFLKEAARDNNLEVGLAEIGARKAQNPQLKALCQQLEQDHLQADRQLQPIAQKHGVSLDQPLKKGDRKLAKFENESPGPKFDQDLATDFVRQHQEDISKFQTAATQIQDPGVQQYAQMMVPKLQAHLRHATMVAQAVGVDQATISSLVNNRTPSAMGGTGTAQESELGTGAGYKNEKGAGARQLQQDAKPQQP